MKREKYHGHWYNPENILNWSEEEFRDTICKMVNVKILTGENLTPFLNAFYLQESAQWYRDRLLNEELKEGKMWRKDNKIWYSEEEYNELKEEYEALKHNYAACEKEYNALTKRYHELQGVLHANTKRI